MDDRAARAAQVLELIHLLEGFLGGSRSRAEVAEWALATPSHAYAWHGSARAVYASILNIADHGPCSSDHIVRVQDVRAYLRWLVDGDAMPGGVEIGSLRVPWSELLGRLPRSTSVRSWLDGIGWMEECRFASPATGRTFVAYTTLDSPGPVTVITWPALSKSSDVAPRVDVCETLSLDAEAFDVQADPFRPWWNRFRATGSIAPLRLGMSREHVLDILGPSPRMSTDSASIWSYPVSLARSSELWLELHFDRDGGLALVYMDTDDAVVVSIPKLS